MRIPHLRLAWTVAAGIVAAWFFYRGAPTAWDVPAVLGAALVALGAALVAYLVWPAFAARLPPGYAIRVTPGGGVVAILLGLMYALLPFAPGRSAAPSPVEVAARFAGMTLAAIALGFVVSVIAVSRTGSRQSGSPRT